MSIQKDTRLGELDGLRAIAVLSVMYYHYTSHYRMLYGHGFSEVFDFDLGMHGVSLFFVISGFVISMTMEKSPTAGVFAWRRVTRLYPIYWFCLLVTFGLVSFFGLYGKETSFSEALINLTMLQDLFKVNHVDESYWSLLPELQFYAFIFIVMLFKQQKWLTELALVWMILTVASTLIEVSGIPNFYKFRYNILFFGGVVYYQLWKGDRSIKLHIYLLISLLLWSYLFPDTRLIIMMLVIFVVFYFICYRDIMFLRSPFLLWIGKMSYTLYLLHQFIGYLLINAIKEYVDSNPFLIIGVPMVIVILLSSMVSTFVEYPSVNYFRKRISVKS